MRSSPRRNDVRDAIARAEALDRCARLGRLSRNLRSLQAHQEHPAPGAEKGEIVATANSCENFARCANRRPEERRFLPKASRGLRQGCRTSRQQRNYAQRSKPSLTARAARPDPIRRTLFRQARWSWRAKPELRASASGADSVRARRLSGIADFSEIVVAMRRVHPTPAIAGLDIANPIPPRQRLKNKHV
jgi:hypothetical protein